MLAHIYYHEGYVPTQPNSVGSADSEVFAANPVWEEHLLPVVPLSVCLEKPRPVLVCQMPQEVLPPFEHLAFEPQIAAHEMVARTLVVDLADPREAGHGARRIIRARDTPLVW